MSPDEPVALAFTTKNTVRNLETAVMVRRALWCLVAALVALGVMAAVGRGLNIGDSVTRANPLREQLLHAVNRDDPDPLHRMPELARMDGRFGAHPWITVLHIGPGAFFLVLAPFQFSSRLRRDHIRLHRWSGRLLISAGLVSTMAGLYFGLLMPFGGFTEAAAIALFGGIFLVAVSRGFLAIRRGDADRHREWMIRAFAVAVGISTVRVVGVIVDIALTPGGSSLEQNFVLSIWIGWSITVAAAEMWIRYTRPLVDVRRRIEVMSGLQ